MRARLSELAARLLRDPVAREQLRRILINPPLYGRLRQIKDSAGNVYKARIE